MSQAKPRVIIFWLLAALVLVSSGWVHWSFGVDGISVFGSYASVLGLIVTFYVAQSVRSVRDQYAVRGTLMQTFERFSAAIRDFDEASKAVEFQPIAGQVVPLVKEPSVHLSKGESVESPLNSLRRIMSCEPRVAQSIKVGVVSQLRSLHSRIEIQLTKDEWRRHNA